MKNKLNKVAKSYCENHVRFMLWDCCDSMHGMDANEKTWEVLTGNKTDLNEYIKNNLSEYYLEQVEEAQAEIGEALTEDDIKGLIVKPKLEIL